MLKYASLTLPRGYNIEKGRGGWNVKIGDWKSHVFNETSLFWGVSQLLLSMTVESRDDLQLQVNLVCWLHFERIAIGGPHFCRKNIHFGIRIHRKFSANRVLCISGGDLDNWNISIAKHNYRIKALRFGTCDPSKLKHAVITTGLLESVWNNINKGRSHPGSH